MSNIRNFYTTMLNKKTLLTSSQRKVAEYIIANDQKAPFLTAQELARCCGVSLSTVVRTATGLGFMSYQALRKCLADIAISSNSPTWHELEDSWLNPDRENYFANVVKDNIETLGHIVTPSLILAVQNSVEILNDAEGIHIMGNRSSRASAFALYSSFQQFLQNVHLMGIMGGDYLYEQLLHIDNNDVFVAISNGYPYYTVQTIDAVQFIGKQGVPVILITDNMSNPAVPFCKEVIHIPSCKSHFSLVPIMTVLEAIIVGLGQKNSEEAANNLRMNWETLIKNGITLGADLKK